MFLKQTKRDGRVYLSVVQNYREDGRVRSKTVESLGYVDELARQFPNPVEHFKSYVADLNRQREVEAQPVRLTIPRNAHIAPEGADAVSLGAALCIAYLDVLDAGAFFGSKPTGRIFELLAAARMMHAVPMHQTWNDRSKFPRRCGDDYIQAYQALSRIADKAQGFVAHLNRRYETLRQRRGLDNVRLVFSNYTFDWPARGQQGGPDESARSQQGRFCIAIDSRGIPLTYRVVAHDLSAQQMRALADDVKAETEARKITLVAAQVPNAHEVMQELTASDNGFVLLLPAKEASSQLNEWVCGSEGYRPANNRSFLLKARTSPHQLAGKGNAIPCKEIAFKGAGAHQNEAFCIISSETQLSDASIFNIYRELWRVHEPFQIITADFISAPLAVDTRVHLEAHFCLCYAAFFALRMMREDMNWQFNAASVADALLRMEGAFLDENWFLFNYRTEVTDAVQAACGVDQARRIMSRDDIRRAIAQAKRAIARPH